MSTVLISHKNCLEHLSTPGHPECEDRLGVVLSALNESDFDNLDRLDALDATDEQLSLVHDRFHIQNVMNNVPDNGHNMLDGDTYLSPGSVKAALKAAGSVCQAVDNIMGEKYKRVFCAVRPPGHHAEPDRAMGFCLFNSVAIGAMYARNKYFCHKVAIIDFDVHHGNGTQTVAEKTKGLFYGSSHQSPLYPGTGHVHDHGKGVIVNVPLAAGSGSNAFRKAYENRILPELDSFAPDIIFISAGFDGHRMDPLADLKIETDDYEWVTSELIKMAEKHAKGRLISSLEGGYNLSILPECVKSHVLALMKS